MAAMSAQRGWRRLWRNAAAALLLVLGSGQAHAIDAPDSIEAVWKSHTLMFEYRGYSTLYTCGGLRDKLTKVLVNLGARRAPTLRAYTCDEGSSVVRFEVAFESPLEATPENVRALTNYDSREVLAARVRGEQLPGAQDLERFPASWKTVSFARDRKLGLDRSDCELVQQLRQQILSRMSVQVIRGQRQCSPFGNISPPQLTVTALVAEER